MKIKLTESQFNHILKEMRFDGKSTGLFTEEEPVNEYYSDPYLTTEPQDKYQRLEKDIMGIVDKYSGDFGVDSYGVIDVIYQVLDQMFPRV
jgi:hypothetical protein